MDLRSAGASACDPVRRRAILLAFAVAVGGITVAVDPLVGGLRAATLGAGATVVASCDSDGVHVAFILAPGSSELVSAVVLSGIDASCAGATLDVTVATPAGVTRHVSTTLTATHPAAAHMSVTLALSDPVPARELTLASVVITA